MEHARAFLFDWDWAGAEAGAQEVPGVAGRRFRSAVLASRWPWSYWALGQPKEALRLARRTRELDPRSPYLAILEADYLLRADQFDAAIALYEYAIGAEPENSKRYFGLAEARSRQGRFEEAIEARRKAHVVAGDDRLAGAVRDRARARPGTVGSTRPGCGCRLDELKDAAEDQVRVATGLRPGLRAAWRQGTGVQVPRRRRSSTARPASCS